MKNKCNLLVLVLLFLVFTLNINAQEGFGAEVNIGPTIGDSKEYFSYALQGNFYYLWELTESFDLGISTGVSLFLGEGNNADGSNGWFSSIPDIFIPISLASRIGLSESFYAGLDIGYALSANAIGDSDDNFFDDDSGGFYIRPLVAYEIKKKLALILSYSSISENKYNSSFISFGVSLGF